MKNKDILFSEGKRVECDGYLQAGLGLSHLLQAVNPILALEIQNKATVAQDV